MELSNDPRYGKMGRILLKMFEDNHLTLKEATDFLMYFVKWMGEVTGEYKVDSLEEMEGVREKASNN